MTKTIVINSEHYVTSPIGIYDRKCNGCAFQHASAEKCQNARHTANQEFGFCHGYSHDYESYVLKNIVSNKIDAAFQPTMPVFTIGQILDELNNVINQPDVNWEDIVPAMEKVLTRIGSPEYQRFKKIERQYLEMKSKFE